MKCDINHIKDVNVLNALNHFSKKMNIKFNSSKYEGLDSLKIREDCIYINDFKVDNTERASKVDDLSGLENLYIYDLSIVGVDLSDCEFNFFEEHYRELELSYLNIVDISDLKTVLSSTMYVNLSHNKIRDISAFKDKAFDMRSIINLDLSYNRIKYISSLYEYEKLKILNLSSNKIEELMDFKLLRSLEDLNVSNNRIKKIEPLIDLSHLKYLDITNNDIEDIENVLFIKNLLNVKYNKDIFMHLVINEERTEKDVRKLQAVFRDTCLPEKWEVLDSEKKYIKETEIKNKIHELHPLRDFELHAIAENIDDEEDYVIYYINPKCIILANLSKHDYISESYQIGFVAFRNISELLDYIMNGNYVI